MVKTVNVEEERTAKFNAGIAKLMRIGKLREACHDARIFNKYKLWYSALKGIRSEINSKLTTPDDEKDKQSEREIADEYENILQHWFDNEKDTIVEYKKYSGRVEDLDIDKVLFDYELWLGDIEEKYKFGMPDVDDEGL